MAITMVFYLSLFAALVCAFAAGAAAITGQAKWVCWQMLMVCVNIAWVIYWRRQ